MVLDHMPFFIRKRRGGKGGEERKGRREDPSNFLALRIYDVLRAVMAVVLILIVTEVYLYLPVGDYPQGRCFMAGKPNTFYCK